MQPRLPFDEPATSHPAPRTPHPLVFARHPRARRYVIRVQEDGTVRVTIPRWGSKKGAAEFAEREQAWIDRQLQRTPVDRPEPVEGRAESIALAKRTLPARLLELAARHGLTVARVSVRSQKWRWGSCSRSGHICLNWRLVTMPEWVRDYVLVHELMHLKRMDHSPRFWKLVAAACPEYQSARAWLRSAPRG